MISTVPLQLLIYWEVWGLCDHSLFPTAGWSITAAIIIVIMIITGVIIVIIKIITGIMAATIII